MYSRAGGINGELHHEYDPDRRLGLSRLRCFG